MKENICNLAGGENHQSGDGGTQAGKFGASMSLSVSLHRYIYFRIQVKLGVKLDVIKLGSATGICYVTERGFICA